MCGIHLSTLENHEKRLQQVELGLKRGQDRLELIENRMGRMEVHLGGIQEAIIEGNRTVSHLPGFLEQIVERTERRLSNEVKLLFGQVNGQQGGIAKRIAILEHISNIKAGLTPDDTQPVDGDGHAT